MSKYLQRRQLLFVQRYLDELTLYLSDKTINRLQILGQFLGTILFTTILGFLFLSNSAPLGITIKYALGENAQTITPLGPKNRVEQITLNGQQVTKISDDLVYFSTDMPFQFNNANVKVYFQNSAVNQPILIGFQDQQSWHYAVKPIDVPVLNSLNWPKIGTDPILYQRSLKYNSVDSFISNPPTDSIIGTYAYDSGIGDVNQTTLSSYKPQKQNTIINTPLRGKQTMYVYLNNEPFHMKIYKQDLNWYQGPDPVTVTVYKDNQIVLEQTADDDGITDASHKVLPPQEIEVNNPGPGLPESGVYKVVIDATGDTIIKSIQTNLHKIVFVNSIFLAGNKEVYPKVVASTLASTIYTNALSLSAITYHQTGEQTIMVGNQPYNLEVMKTPLIITPQDTLAKVVVPKNDVASYAFQGFFAFSPDQFFLPSQYHVLPINTADDVSLVDYILTEYNPSHEEAGWQTNTQSFDLSSAYILNNKLSWVIQAPNLKKNGNTLIIKDIQVTFHKKGWNN